MIRLKGKDSSLYNIEAEVRNAAHSAAYSLTGSPLNTAIEQIVTQAVMAGMRQLIKEQYTDEDFETDLGLRPGPKP